jgi:hypothetical protein
LRISKWWYRSPESYFRLHPPYQQCNFFFNVDDIQDVDQDETQIEEKQKGKRIGMYVHVKNKNMKTSAVMQPYKGERYLVLDFHRSIAPRTPKEKFNKIHSQKCNVIERNFAVRKMKWKIPHKMPIIQLKLGI